MQKSLKWLRVSMILGLTMLSVSWSWGQVPHNDAEMQANAHDYYTLDDSQNARPRPEFETPETYFMQIESTSARLLAGGMSLLKWVHHETDPSAPPDAYNRKRHFGTWVNDPNDTTCYNTRAQVLIRDSQRPVAYQPNNHCVVATGLWKDPYTGELFESARQIQIDHVVPLKHAYLSGAWQWTPRKRCAYANFMGSSFHLLSVSGRENMRKGDRAPDQYMPPDHNETCSYIESWLKIKMIWGLIIWPDEASAIVDEIRNSNCQLVNFQIQRGDVLKMRDAENDVHGCDRFEDRSTSL